MAVGVLTGVRIMGVKMERLVQGQRKLSRKNEEFVLSGSNVRKAGLEC